MHAVMNVEPVVLSGNTIRLVPLSLEHVDGLTAVGLDPELWRWIPVPVTTPQEMQSYVETALDEQKRGVALPFAILDASSGEVIGCTRYANIERSHFRLEIGWTWYAKQRQRTGANTEAKLLLLTHAFETLGANRVELKTDALNTQSRNAIGRIGGVQEGIFRQHLITASGRVRDTVYFSIIRGEWPLVKERLIGKIAKH
ncbi:MAG: GNAT family protein [Gemmatimonadaceae bacterium]